MNKTEKLICLVLGAVLAWYIFSEMGKSKEAAKEQSTAAQAEIESNSVDRVAGAKDSKVADAKTADTKDAIGADAKDLKDTRAPEVVNPSTPEKIVTLENDEVKLELSTWGAVVRKDTLKKYAKDCGPISEENPPAVLRILLRFAARGGRKDRGL